MNSEKETVYLIPTGKIKCLITNQADAMMQEAENMGGKLFIRPGS